MENVQSQSSGAAADNRSSSDAAGCQPYWMPELLLAMFEQAPFSIQVLNPDGTTLKVNPAWEKLWGFTFEHLAGYNMLQDEQLVVKGIMPYIRRGFAGEPTAIPPIVYDPRDRFRDSRDRWVRAFIYPVKDAAGAVRQVVLVHEDITQRMQADEALVQSRQQLSDILDSLADCITVQNKEGQLVYANAGAARALGYSSVDRLLELPLLEIMDKFEVLDEDGKPLSLAEIPGRKVLQGAPASNATLRFRIKATGEERWSEVQAAPVLDEKGELLYAINMFRDITERRRSKTERQRLIEQIDAERQGKEEAQRFLSDASATLVASLDYATTLHAIADLAVPALADWCAVDILSETGEVQRLAVAHVDPEKVERGYELSRRYPPSLKGPHGVSHVLRTGCAELLREITDDFLNEAIGDKELISLLQYIGLRSVMTVPLMARGKIMGAISFIAAESGRLYGPEDLELAEELSRRAALAVDNARLYQEARQAREAAEMANHAKDEFLATLSHELRTPLTAMVGWAHLLRTAQLSEEETERALEAIERNTRTQTQLIEDLLDVSRIVTGKLNIESNPVELRQIIEAALETVQPGAAAKSILLQRRFDPGVRRVLGDARRLQQVVWNLLANAIKFTPPGGQVQVSLKDYRQYVQIQVSDTGEGIKPDFLPYVFNRFRQADSSSTRQHGGLGLGLSIVRHVVEMQGGEVAVASEGPGKGATFTVRIPALEVITASNDEGPSVGDRLPCVAALSADAEMEAVESLSGVRILVVDDEADTREVLELMLGRCGAQVKTAPTVREALQEFGDWAPHVLLSDIGLPEEDGYALIRQVRDLLPEQGGSVRSIALTAFGHKEDRERALSAGFQVHVAKPAQPAELLNIIESLLHDD